MTHVSFMDKYCSQRSDFSAVLNEHLSEHGEMSETDRRVMIYATIEEHLDPIYYNAVHGALLPLPIFATYRGKAVRILYLIAFGYNTVTSMGFTTNLSDAAFKAYHVGVDDKPKLLTSVLDLKAFDDAGIIAPEKLFAFGQLDKSDFTQWRITPYPEATDDQMTEYGVFMDEVSKMANQAHYPAWAHKLFQELRTDAFNRSIESSKAVIFRAKVMSLNPFRNRAAPVELDYLDPVEIPGLIAMTQRVNEWVSFPTVTELPDGVSTVDTQVTIGPVEVGIQWYEFADDRVKTAIQDTLAYYGECFVRGREHNEDMYRTAEEVRSIIVDLRTNFGGKRATVQNAGAMGDYYLPIGFSEGIVNLVFKTHAIPSIIEQAFAPKESAIPTDAPVI